MYIYTHTYVYIHINTYTYIYTYIYICIYIYIYIYIYTHTYTHKYIHINTHKYIIYHGPDSTRRVAGCPPSSAPSTSSAEFAFLPAPRVRTVSRNSQNQIAAKCTIEKNHTVNL